MPRLVLDTSWVAASVFEDEASAEADAPYVRVVQDGIVVPAIWPLEVANMIRQGERRGRIATSNLDATLARLLAIPCQVEPVTSAQALTAILNLARLHGLTSYDASYLSLAMGSDMPLATRDGALIRTARAEGVALVT